MVIGLGIDIVQNNRIENIINKWGDKFLNKFFTQEEINILSRTKNKNQRFAGNYAVKEAFVKALGTGFRGGTKFKSIEVKRDKLGKPYIDTTNGLNKIINKKGVNKIHTTISHEKEYSVAVVIFES